MHDGESRDFERDAPIFTDLWSYVLRSADKMLKNSD